MQTRIGIVTGDDFHTYAAILAILANGSAYVPLNNHNPVARNLAVAREAELAAVVSTSGGELRAAVHHEHGSDLPWIDAMDAHSAWRTAAGPQRPR